MRVGGTVGSEAFATLRGALILCWRGRGRRSPLAYIGTDPLPDTFIDKSQPWWRATPDRKDDLSPRSSRRMRFKYEAAPGGKGGAPPALPTQGYVRAGGI